MSINILCIGDVVGSPGRNALANCLPRLISDRQIDLVVCNAENIAGGSGITPPIFRKVLSYGVDVVTMGDHAYRRAEIIQTMETSDRIIRPANLSPIAAGRRWTVVPTKSGTYSAGVVCLLGQLYINSPAAGSPWQAADRALTEMGTDVKIRIVDFHAEASSEKIAMGWYLNGRASIVFGTHTHIPTADGRVLDGGTAYVSDVGMTGPYDGVLGRRKDRVLKFLTTSMPAQFHVATDDVRLCGALVAVNPDNGRAESIERVEVPCPPSPAGETDGETD